MIYPRFSEGVSRIWSEDRVSQEHYLTIIAEETRGLPFELFEKLDAFFVPNNNYLIEYFGIECTNYEYEMYDYNQYCLLQGCVVIPCKALNGNIIAWIAYNPSVKMHASETQDYSTNYYSYPSKLIWDKSKYLFTMPDIYKKALEDGYLVLTDGVFDTLSLINYGVNSAALLGSYLTECSTFLLRFIPKVYVSVDNDEAGNKMLRSVQRFIPTAKAIRQGVGKDVDDILKSEHRDSFLEELQISISNNIDLLYR